MKRTLLISLLYVSFCTLACAHNSFAQNSKYTAAPSAQTTNAAPLPDAPVPDGELPQTKRILGIVPNFRSVSANTKLPPQTKTEKLKTGLQDSFDYSNFIYVALQSGVSQGLNSYPEFGSGAAAYGRYYWHGFADTTDENLLVESLLPIAFKQDSRYYTLGHGGFFKRTGYALSRAVITRTDSGGETFNASEILGAGGAASISSLYYPTHYQTWTKIGQRWLFNVGLDSATFGVKEWWPDINHKFFHDSGQ